MWLSLKTTIAGSLFAVGQLRVIANHDVIATKE